MKDNSKPQENFQPDEEMAARQTVAEAGRDLLAEKLVARTWGNISCRTGPRTFVITPSGLAYDNMTAMDVVPFDMDSGVWTGHRKPSSEKGVHTAAYTQFADAGFVIHTHQTYASALGLAGFETGLIPPEAKIALGGIARARYGLPGTKRLKENVREALASGAHVILMAQHGALIVGKDREDTLHRAKQLEDICRKACKGQPEYSTQYTGRESVSESSREKGSESSRESLSESSRETGSEPDRKTGSLPEWIKLLPATFGHVMFTDEPAVREVASSTTGFSAQLDDMAQMIGPRLVVVKPEIKAVIAGLQAHPAILVTGLGAICRAGTAEDGEAMRLLVEKACVCFLHTRALGVRCTLSALDAQLMRFVYRKKYSKQIRG